MMARPATDDPTSFSAYYPLPSRTKYFRLVSLSREHDDALVRCRLETHRLNAAPPYQALSYAWGKPNAYDTIIIGDKPETLRTAAAKFLAALQHIHSENHLWWIDMLCINQHDLAEQSSQIELMGDIYRGAQAVHAWLGPEDKDSKLAFSKGAEVALMDESEPLNPWGKYPSDPEKLFWQKRQSCVIRPALARLFLRGYWTRVWIIQELILAQKLTFVCGLRTMSHRTMVRMCSAYWMDDFGLDQDQKTSFIAGYSTFHKLEVYRRHRYPPAHISFMFFSRNQCKFPRDKVYGLRQLLPNPDALRVDSSKSALDVFLDVVHLGIFGQKGDKGDAIMSAYTLLRSMGETTESLAAHVRRAIDAGVFLSSQDMERIQAIIGEEKKSTGQKD